MPRRRAWVADDVGSAALEFITVGVILLVPFIYLVLVLGALQEQALGVESAARHTARAVALSGDEATAADAAREVVAAVAAEYGIDPASIEVALDCGPTARACPEPGATVTVTVRATARLPFVPPVLGLDEATAIPLTASSVQKISSGGAP